jgi:hypothetical protein
MATGKRRRSRYEGIVLRHARGCRSRDGAGCSCTPGYQAQVWSARERKTIRKTFRSLVDARTWRQESQIALRKGQLRSPSEITLIEAAAEWLAAAQTGVVRTRSGEAYKPSAIRAYRQALNHRVLPTLGSKRITAISHTMLQDFADELSSKGLQPSSVRNTILRRPRTSPRRSRHQPDAQTRSSGRAWPPRTHRRTPRTRAAARRAPT